MCQKCEDAIKKFWPNLPQNRWNELLWNITCFPAGCGEQVAKKLEEMAIKSGQDLGKAIGIAWDELMEEHKKQKEREQNEIT